MKHKLHSQGNDEWLYGKASNENPFKGPTHIPKMTPAITTKISPYLTFNINNCQQPKDSFREKIDSSYENDQSKPKGQKSVGGSLPEDILEIGKREEIWRCERAECEENDEPDEFGRFSNQTMTERAPRLWPAIRFIILLDEQMFNHIVPYGDINSGR